MKLVVQKIQDWGKIGDDPDTWENGYMLSVLVYGDDETVIDDSVIEITNNAEHVARLIRAAVSTQKGTDLSSDYDDYLPKETLELS